MRHSALAFFALIRLLQTVFAHVEILHYCEFSTNSIRVPRLYPTGCALQRCAIETATGGHCPMKPKTMSAESNYELWQGATPLVLQDIEGRDARDPQCQHDRGDRVGQFGDVVSEALL